MRIHKLTVSITHKNVTVKEKNALEYKQKNKRLTS